MACVMLKLLPEYANLPIARNRDMEVVKRASIVVDVGDIYDPETHRYDHHQATFGTSYSEKYEGVTKLSSAGLIFKHFGARIISAICSSDGEGPSAAEVDVLVRKVYSGLILELDCIDNGVEPASETKYRIVTGLGRRVGRLNGSWLETVAPEDENNNFKEAMERVYSKAEANSVEKAVAPEKPTYYQQAQEQVARLRAEGGSASRITSADSSEDEALARTLYNMHMTDMLYNSSSDMHMTDGNKRKREFKKEYNSKQTNSNTTMTENGTRALAHTLSDMHMTDAPSLVEASSKVWEKLIAPKDE